MWIYSNNQDQVIWLAESKKWVWHLNLFSRTRVKGGNLHAFVIYTWQFAYRLFGLWQENRECWLTVHSCRQEKYLDKKTCYGYLTHCILNRLSHTIYWKSPISIFGAPSYEIYIFLEKNGRTICKQWRTRSDAAFCGVWSGSALFANYPFTGLSTTMRMFL